jgi:transcriptional regulator with XRE-family HTH domain
LVFLLLNQQFKYGFSDHLCLLLRKKFLVDQRQKLTQLNVIKACKNNHNIYQYYFQDVAKSLGVPLEFFKGPLYVRQPRKQKTHYKNFRTFSPSYLSLLLLSEKFQIDFEDFLQQSSRIEMKAKMRLRLTIFRNKILKFLEKKVKKAHLSQLGEEEGRKRI